MSEVIRFTPKPIPRDVTDEDGSEILAEYLEEQDIASAVVIGIRKDNTLVMTSTEDQASDVWELLILGLRQMSMIDDDDELDS